MSGIMKNVRKPEGKRGEEVLERMNKNHTPVSLWTLEHVDIEDDCDILDIGCGGGINLKRLHELSPNGRTIGIDYSSTSVKKSIEFNQELVDEGKIEVIEADVQNIPLDDSSIDIATAFETVYFWPNIVDSFIEVRRVLKDDALFMIVLTTNGDKDNLYDDLKKEVELEVYDDEELFSLLTEAGFRELTAFIKVHETKKERIKTFVDGTLDEVVIDDLFDDDVDDGHHMAPEWLCVVAKK